MSLHKTAVQGHGGIIEVMRMSSIGVMPLLVALVSALPCQAEEAVPTVALAPAEAAPSFSGSAATATATAAAARATATAATAAAEHLVPREMSDNREHVESLAKSDPEAFVRHCRDSYDRRDVRDYTCRFVKQETIGSKLGRVEELDVNFRESPFSVDMRWTKNPGQANRALYVANAWVDDDGNELAWFKPAGALIKLIVPKVQQPINGDRVKSSSRRSLDQFGFKRTLDVIIKYIEKGRESGQMQLSYVGERSIAGRPTWLFERRLPYNGDEEQFPDALLWYHIDQEWLVPVACYSYGDSAGRQLLGSYVVSAIRFNVGLTDDQFNPDKNNF